MKVLKNNFVLLIAFCVGFIITATAETFAETFDEPLWEAGFVTAAFSGPAYPAANDETSAALISPYFIYRGDIFSIGDEGAFRALAFANDRIEIDLSLGASLPANSDDDADRQGMPDLDFLFEIGPQLIWHARRHNFGQWQGDFDVKLRARSVISLGDFDSQGYLFEPSFVYEMQSKTHRHLSWQADLELLFGNDRLNRYFYNVSEAQETGTRRAHKAEAGYIGAEIGLGLSYPVNDNLRLFIGGNVELYNGAANQDSPLFKEDVAYSGGVVVVYSFYESKARVRR